MKHTKGKAVVRSLLMTREAMSDLAREDMQCVCIPVDHLTTDVLAIVWGSEDEAEWNPNAVRIKELWNAADGKTNKEAARALKGFDVLFDYVKESCTDCKGSSDATAQQCAMCMTGQVLKKVRGL